MVPSTGSQRVITYPVSDLFEPDVLASLLRQWSRSLRPRHRTPRTIETYTDTAERWKRTTVAFRYRSLQQLTNWLAAEAEIDADPMAGMSAPHAPEQPVPVLTDDQLRALLAACRGTGWPRHRSRGGHAVPAAHEATPVCANADDQ